MLPYFVPDVEYLETLNVEVEHVRFLTCCRST